MESSRDILNFDREELTAELAQRFGLPPFRARQLFPWLYRTRAVDFSVMTDISREVRATLAQSFEIFRPEPVTVQLSSDGTRKYLFAVREGDKVESVLIKQPTRYTLCVSSQVGCAMGCTFCRTAQMGLKRNLLASEIIGQVLAVQDDIAKLGAEPFQNIVFMGMGEPLHNLENVVRAVRLLNDGLGLNFSARKITVSTSGLVPAMEKFGASGADANLAVSLNATTDEIRTGIMPVNRRWPLATLLDCLRRYPVTKRRRITIEYVMLRGINDSSADLERLPGLLRGIPVKVNLIPYNNNVGLGLKSDMPFQSSRREVVYHWQERLLSKGVTATVRWSKGEDISAACGQLATAEIKLRGLKKLPAESTAVLA